jgi:oxygen-independent coproporphyrinogen-3 oxidase
MENMKQRYVDAVCKEIKSYYSKEEKSSTEWSTIYLGGGTPSQLNESQLRQIFSAIGTPSKDIEITMECNPDDVTEDFANMIGALPINRISMGAQTFSDKRLSFLHRRHNASEVNTAVKRLRKAGINNISVDLMFGFPEETLEDWQSDIKAALDLNVEHLSAYSLMYEEGTPLFHLLQQGKIKEIDDELSLKMYDTLVDMLTAADYEHYEISNFARKGFRSRHNSSYWNSTPYIGIGAAAHSFVPGKRWWNVSNIKKYCEGIENNTPERETEIIDADTHYNDLITTALRTSDGLNLDMLSLEQQNYLLANAQHLINEGMLKLNNKKLSLTRQGIYISDSIMSDLIKV